MKDEIDYGIKRIEILGKKNDKSLLDDEKLKQLELDTKSSIVKMESIICTRLVLLCI